MKYARSCSSWATVDVPSSMEVRYIYIYIYIYKYIIYMHLLICEVCKVLLQLGNRRRAEQSK